MSFGRCTAEEYLEWLIDKRQRAIVLRVRGKKYANLTQAEFDAWLAEWDEKIAELCG